MQLPKTVARGAPPSAVPPNPTASSPFPGDYPMLGGHWRVGEKMLLAVVPAGCAIVRGLARVRRQNATTTLCAW
eukprot:6205251-Pleurochrysis_carterae.AAC.3